MEILWFIPTHGDGRYLGTSRGGRAITPAYLRQVAQAVDELGFTGALLPTGRSCEDAWLTAMSLVPVTRRMRFLVALRPGLISPALAAQMAASFDRISNGRLLLNVVTGGDPVEMAGQGVLLDHDARYAVTDEFLSVWRNFVSGERFSHSGEHFQIRDGELLLKPLQQPYPPLYFGGSSPAGHAVAARHADVYLTWGEPPAQVAEKIADLRQRAAAHGRTLRFGMRVHVIVRNSDKAAWEAAEELIQYLDDDSIAAAQQVLARYDSHGQQRQRALSNRARDQLEVSPNLWAGVGLVRGGVGTALVGSAEAVAERMLEYNELGIESFVMSGYPHLEEAYRTAELLFPRLPVRPPPTPQLSDDHQVVGEILANDFLARKH